MLLIPIGHDDQKVRRLPYITIALIVLNSLIFLYTFTSGPSEADLEKPIVDVIQYYASHPYLRLPQEFRSLFNEDQLQSIDKHAVDPADSGVSPEEQAQEQEELNQKVRTCMAIMHTAPDYEFGHRSQDPVWWSYFTCIFLHGSILHLVGNMLFLYLAGCSLEDVWGRPLYICFYLAGGIWATLSHDLRFPNSAVPLIGASGAIAALMGAFLVRFHKTNIRFWYLIGIWIRGKFSAPAWITLPLWLVLQIVMDKVAGQEAGVAFWAHIGGFVGGVIFGLVINMMRFEEKFIAPHISRQVEITMNPNYLKAVGLAQQMDYVQARNLLNQALREEPDLIEAHMELRRIAELTGNQEAYAAATSALLESLVRKKDGDTALQVYRELDMRSPQRRVALTARSLGAMAGFLEHVPDYRSALEVYQVLAELHPDDPQTVKAYSRCAAIYLEKFDNRQEGIEYLKKAYLHPRADESWKASVKAEFKRYQIPVPEDRPAKEIPPAAPAPAPVPVPTPVSVHEPAAMFVSLPDASFHAGNSGAVSVWIDAIDESGLILKNEAGISAGLDWTSIGLISAGRIRPAAGTAPAGRTDYLVLDLMPAGQRGASRILYRTFSYRLDLKKLQPASANSGEAYRAMMNRLILQSGAVCVPSREGCLGPSFQVFPGIPDYDRSLVNFLAAISKVGS